jgi:hypothetical protein
MGGVANRATVDNRRKQFKEGILESRAELLIRLERISQVNA